ncbi:hypothetical protein [Silvibacterium acidisoli]|uniref:hypothetical protein n=1 Tax=Acidobacteriaceae bacterium ZG23-2 TaxID=2883246 RepID=UPI00406BFE1B
MAFDRVVMIASIDEEIARLEEIKSLLDASYSTAKVRKQHSISVEGRERIAEAQRRRWARDKSLKD